MPYSYKLPIGDPSSDGHGRCEWFLVTGDLPISELYAANNKCRGVFGFDVDDMCKESRHLTADMVKVLISKGIISEDPEYYGPDELVQLWLDILNHINPKLKLQIATEEASEYWGLAPGYSCFM